MSQSPKQNTILKLIRERQGWLVGALIASLCETAVTLLGPWPVKVVFDSVVDKQPLPPWMQAWTGDDKLELLMFAAIAALVIAIAGAIFSYAQKHFTTTVGQWLAHDLRRTLYFHIQRMSIAFHDEKPAGDLISRLTSDISAIQGFVTGGMLDAVIQSLTLVGMLGVMLYLNWRFTLIALSVTPVLFLVIFYYTRKIKKFSREVRKTEGEIVSVVQETLSSFRVVKAFAREDYEQQRLEEQSLESVEAALKARDRKSTRLNSSHQ